MADSVKLKWVESPSSWAARIPKGTWDQHEPELEKLYMTERRSLGDVMGIMKEQNFHAS
jgi:Clr5 domain